MAIRFSCPSCEQPIEVDDDWANQQVGCPYCQRMVSAPAASTLNVDTIPTASGQPGGAFVPPPPPADAVGERETPLGRTRRIGPLGIYAFVAGAGALAAMLLWTILFMGWITENMDPEVFKSQKVQEERTDRETQ